MVMAKSMPVKTITAMVGEHDTRIWRIIHHDVDQAREQEDYSSVSAVGVNETSSKRGHNYVTIVADLARSKVLFVTEDKDTSTLQRFRNDLAAHRGNPASVTKLCNDMSPAFIKSIRENVVHAQLTFDKVHIMQIINTAVNEVRGVRSNKSGQNCTKAGLSG